MRRTAKIEVCCGKDKAGTVGIEVLRFGVCADDTYVEDMREMWEVIGRGVLSRILKDYESGDHTYHVEFDMVAELDEKQSWLHPNVYTEHERVMRGQAREAWIRTNLLEAGAWWANN